MGRDQSSFEDFVEIMSRIPWWVNIILAVIAYITLHQIAMTYYEPAPKLEVGQMGDFAADKMKSTLALFGQFIIPFGFLLAGLIGLIKKFRKTGQYKELIFYIIINVLFFGSIISKEGSAFNAMKNRMDNPTKHQIVNNPTEKNVAEKPTSESGNEIILAKPKEFKGTIYSWRNEKGERIFSNTGFPKDGKYTDGKIEMN